MAREATARSSSQDAYDRIEAALESAARFVPRERGEAMFRKWVPRRDRDIEGLAEDRMIAMAADAVLLAADLLLSQPSASGTTAFDRLAKNCTGAAPEEAAAIAALCKARFRLLRIEEIATADGCLTRDVLLDEVPRIAGPDLPPLPSGSHLFGRVVHLGGEKFCFVGAITPLDAAAFMTARSHPAAGAQNLGAAARWAEAVYAHVVRNATLAVPGLNRPADDADGGDLFEPGQDELRDLSLEWLDLADAALDAELLQRTRQSAGLANILDALAAAVLSRDTGRAEIAFAVERLLLVQLETVRRREASGAVTLTLNAVAGALDHAMRSRAWLQRVRTLFETLRAQVSGGRLADDPALERLVHRIQALRAKTVAQGCTEQEALAAAEKVAELLDWHGIR